MRSFGLIGYPLSHSFSKKYFEEKFEKEWITDCQYALYPIPSIVEFPLLIQDNPSLEGLNVTIPYKKQVIEYLDEKKMPPGLEACNCIAIRNGRLTGYNTDWTAFKQSIIPLLKPEHRSAIVLGTGGASEAIVFGLKEMGIHVSLVSRAKKPNVSYVYGQLDREIIEQHKIIINTTPVGLYPNADEAPAIPYDAINSHHLLYDLVYNPEETLFLSKGKARGATVKNGLEMLVGQAEESWRIWND